MAAPATTTAPIGDGPSGRARPRTVVPVLLTVAILLILELVVRASAHRLPTPQTWSPPEAQLKNSQIDAAARAHRTGGVVFLSTSVLDVGVDPEAFIADTATTLPVYNASLAGANLEEVRWWEDHIVLPKLRPKFVVIGLSSREVNGNDPQGAAIAGQFFASDPVRRIDGSESIWQRLERYGDDVSYLFRYRKDFRSPDAVYHDFGPINGQALFTSPLGQELVLAHQKFISGANVDAYFQANLLANWQLTPAKLVILTGIIDDAKAAGAQILLVDAPVTQYYINLHPQGATSYASYEHALAGVVASTHVAFVPSQVWSESLFADPIHLDETGAMRLSAELAARLRPQLTGGSP